MDETNVCYKKQSLGSRIQKSRNFHKYKLLLQHVAFPLAAAACVSTVSVISAAIVI